HTRCRTRRTFIASPERAACARPSPRFGRRNPHPWWLRTAAGRGSNKSGSAHRAIPPDRPSSAARLPSPSHNSSGERPKQRQNSVAATIGRLRPELVRADQSLPASRTAPVLAVIRRSQCPSFPKWRKGPRDEPHPNRLPPGFLGGSRPRAMRRVRTWFVLDILKNCDIFSLKV